MSSYCRFMNSYTNTHTYTQREDKGGKKRERERKVSVKKKIIPNQEEFPHPKPSGNFCKCLLLSQ